MTKATLLGVIAIAEMLIVIVNASPVTTFVDELRTSSQIEELCEKCFMDSLAVLKGNKRNVIAVGITQINMN